MTRRLVVTGALALATSLVHVPAYAAGEFTITVAPTEGEPSDVLTVTGDATDPTCADDGVVVNLTYTKPDGTDGTTSVNTVADSAGHFSAQITIPDTAVAGAPASVTAVVADCTPPPDGPTSSRSSTEVAVEVLAYEGTLTLGKTSGKPGETVTFSGTDCWGEDIVVALADAEVTDVTLDPDKTFSGSFVVPDAPGGTYEFGAECPGTDFAVLGFTIVNPAAPPVPPAPPAQPVPGRPRFTG